MLEPVEPCPDGDIALSEVKRRYGGKLCLMGNIEMREIENEYVDKARIDMLVREAMDAAKAGSGFMLMPTSFPITIPLPLKTEENYIQMIDSARKYGRYS